MFVKCSLPEYELTWISVRLRPLNATLTMNAAENAAENAAADRWFDQSRHPLAVFMVMIGQVAVPGVTTAEFKEGHPKHT